MAEETIENLLGIEEDTKHVSQSNEKPTLDVDPFAASNGLNKAVSVCRVCMWICAIIAAIGGLGFLSNLGGAIDGYSKDVRNCISGATGLAYGIVGALLSYVVSKILMGLSVMTKVSERYLSNKD
jgi:hypothetical protein